MWLSMSKFKPFIMKNFQIYRKGLNKAMTISKISSDKFQWL